MKLACNTKAGFDGMTAMIWRAVWVTPSLSVRKFDGSFLSKIPCGGARARHFATVDRKLRLPVYHPGYHLNRVTTLMTRPCGGFLFQ